MEKDQSGEEFDRMKTDDSRYIAVIHEPSALPSGLLQMFFLPNKRFVFPTNLRVRPNGDIGDTGLSQRNQ